MFISIVCTNRIAGDFLIRSSAHVNILSSFIFHIVFSVGESPSLRVARSSCSYYRLYGPTSEVLLTTRPITYFEV